MGLTVSEENIINGLIERLSEKGMVLVSADIADEALKLQRAKTKLMRRAKLTPYEISKFRLLPGVTSINTVNNMIADGRILEDEVFVDKSGKRYVIKAAIERLNTAV